MALCTFINTQKQFTNQPVYRCRTCHLVGNLGTCNICVAKCHSGHDIVYDYYGPFFCDCGSRGRSYCNALENTEQHIDTDASGPGKIFECPVCMSYMRGPIHMCTRGHNLCEKCKESIDTCPVCRGEFSGARNFSMESLSRTLTIPCEDCDAKVLISNLNDHKWACTMGIYKCQLTSQCSWACKIWDFSDHYLQRHGDQVLDGPLHKLEHVNFTKSNSEGEVNIVKTSGICFLFHRYFDTTDKIFKGVVKHIVPSDVSFTYTMEFSAADSEEKITFKKTVRLWSEDFKDIYKRCKGVALYMSQATGIVGLNSLNYTLEIQIIDK